MTIFPLEDFSLLFLMITFTPFSDLNSNVTLKIKLPVQTQIFHDTCFIPRLHKYVGVCVIICSVYFSF